VTFLFTFLIMSILFQVVTGNSVFSLMVPSLRGKSIHNIQTNKRAKALAAKQPQYDEYGYRKDYDPHYVRALEIDTGVSVSELTTCSDNGCLTCVPGMNLPVESKVRLPNSITLNEARDLHIQNMIEAQTKAQARIQKQIEEEVEYQTRHDPSSFRPSTVPERATIDSVEKSTATKADAIDIVWTWDDHVYRQRLVGYDLVYAHGEPYLKKKRSTDDNYEDMSLMQLYEAYARGELVWVHSTEYYGGDIGKLVSSKTNKAVTWIRNEDFRMIEMNGNMGW